MSVSRGDVKVIGETMRRERGAGVKKRENN
jgi:hypothetical protein